VFLPSRQAIEQQVGLAELRVGVGVPGIELDGAVEVIDRRLDALFLVELFQRGLGRLVRRLRQPFREEGARFRDAAGAGGPRAALSGLQFETQNVDDQVQRVVGGELVARKAALVAAEDAQAFRIFESGREHVRPLGAVHGETHGEVRTDPAPGIAGSPDHGLPQLGDRHDGKRVPEPVQVRQAYHDVIEESP
jgi:hypothetical protein